MSVPNTDHRSRVAIERRERTRARLLESALGVFAANGVGASVIQQVIAAAKVSQGTFYNYFRTNEELLAAVSEELNNDLLKLIEGEVGGIADPALRIACGIRLYLHTARAYPLLARFTCSAGLHAAGPNSRIYEYLPPHIEEGIASKRFVAMGTDVAVDLIAGTALTSVFRLSTGEAASDYPEQMVVRILRALGIEETEAKKLCTVPLAPICAPPESLLARTRP